MTLADATPPSRLSAFAAVWLTFLCMLIGFACLGLAGLVWSALGDMSFREASAAATSRVEITTLCQAVAMGTAVWLGLRVATEPGQAKAALALAPVPWGRLALSFAAGLCLQFPLSELANLLHAHVFGPQTLEEQKAMIELLAPSSPLLRAVVWLCLGLLVPALEELLFRGTLLTGLIPTQGRDGALLVSAALFGLCHVQPVPIVYAFVAGLLLGLVRLRAGSIQASFAVHAGINTTPILLGPETVPVTGFNLPSADTAHLPAALSLGGLVLGLSLIALAVRPARRQSS